MNFKVENTITKTLLAFILKRKYYHIILFTAGFWVISLLGMRYYEGDLWWLINKMPYSGGAREIYGHGTWYHFFYNTRDI